MIEDTQADADSLRLREVFRSTRLADCDQQSLILAAVGIHSWTVVRGGLFVVMVTEDTHASAQQQLLEAASEATAPVAPRPIPQAHPHAWIGSVVYALVLIGIAYVAGNDSFGFDWFAAGALDGARTFPHEWWRILTSLTLHVDVGHLIGNLTFGMVLGYFVARSLGAGIAWASILLSAALGNALDVVLMPETQQSIGASTAVFAALGLLSAYAWTLESAVHLQWAKRWAPLIAGIILLAFTGAGGERTDVVAHITGFGSGGVLGLIYGKMPETRFQVPWLQAVAGLVGLAALTAAWLLATPV